MPPKRMTRREQQLAAFTHMQEYLQTFLVRWRTPTRRLTSLDEALEEVGRERLLIIAEQDDDTPVLRKTR